MPDAIQTQGLKLIYDSGASTNLKTWTSPVFDTGRFNYVTNVVDVTSIDTSGGMTFTSMTAHARILDPSGATLASGTTAAIQVAISSWTATGTKMLTMTPVNSGSQVIVSSFWNLMGTPPFYDLVMTVTGTTTTVLGRVRVYARD